MKDYCTIFIFLQKMASIKTNLPNIPSKWDIKPSNQLVLNAAKRGYIFSLFYPNEIEQKIICLHCGGFIEHIPNANNCICNKYIKLNKQRKICKYIMYFIHEILLQYNRKNDFLPINWPKIIVGNSENEEIEQNKKLDQIKHLRQNYKYGAFSIYMKKSSLLNLAKLLENIVIDIALIS